MPVFTVSQVARYLKSTMEGDRLLSDLYVTGEVSNVSRSTAGHCYFSLKDGESQLRCIMFRDGLGMALLENGAAVTAHGRVSFYQARGDLQYYTDIVQPEGVGELYMEFLRVKAKLEAEGLFDEARKRPLPPFPRRIAVVTSRTGAVLHDIQNVIARRYPLVELLFLHTPVQGTAATEGIITAFQTLNLQDGIDLVILARGGGSLEELGAFNTEEVARAIHGSRAPVVSAVGHQTDFTIADLVADVRAPTPSAAAELAVPDLRQVRQRIAQSQRTLGQLAAALLASAVQGVRHSAVRLQQLTPDLASHRQRVDELTRTASAVIVREMALRREHVRARELQLGSLHPGDTLRRGYALVERLADRAPVAKTSDVSPGDGIAVRVSDGSFTGTVAGQPAAAPAAVARSRRKGAPKEQARLWE